MVISIIKAEYIEDYKIRFMFSDGVEKIVDFGDFILKSKNRMTQKYADQKLFQNFTLEHGDIQWNDFEMCFPIWDLHEGSV